jgi:CBS-domain-containing membrane protein
MKLVKREKWQKIRRYWHNYLGQILLAFCASCLILWLLDLQHEVIIASIGATAFIMFAKPQSETAQPRHVIMGQAIGLISGFAWAPFAIHSLQASDLRSVIIFACSVITAFVIMVITDTDHPPAAGTALGVTISGCHGGVTLALVFCIFILVAVHQILKKHLRDLL